MSSPGLPGDAREHEARTHPEHPDGSLRGRTYAIPFRDVWLALEELASRKMRRWTVLSKDEDEGVLEARCKPRFSKDPDHLRIRVSLDENGQTRVDMTSSSEGTRPHPARNKRRVRRVFKILDRDVGAGPGKILDPTIPLTRLLLLASLIFLTACDPGAQDSAAPPEHEAASSPPGRNFQSRSYERHIVFLTFQGDSTLVVPLSFIARTDTAGVDREIRGWLARGDTWDAFLSLAWRSPPSSVPWRILPHGPVRLVVGMDDALEMVIYEEGGRNLELILGNLLVEWSGEGNRTFRIHEGELVLADATVTGHLLDLTQARAGAVLPPGDWGILLSGDSLQAVLEDVAPGSDSAGGDFSVQARIQFLERQWQNVRFIWKDVRAFEPARRDVPMSWEIDSPEDQLQGSLTVEAPLLEATEGEGPMLPVDGLFKVGGVLSLDGRDYPVQGFIRHVQR